MEAKRTFSQTRKSIPTHGHYRTENHYGAGIEAHNECNHILQ